MSDKYAHEMPFLLVGPTMLFLHDGVEYVKDGVPVSKEKPTNALIALGGKRVTFDDQTMVYALFPEEEQPS